MILSDGEISEAIATGEIAITGFEKLYIGASSVDLHLDSKAKIMRKRESQYAPMIQTDSQYSLDGLFEDSDNGSSIIINPGEFHLWSTIETIRFSDSIAGFIQGRSSIARLGLNIHNAGFFDAGFEGTATLEVTNLTPYPIYVPKGTRICQMVFERMGRPALIPYNKKKDQKYMGQKGATETKAHKDYEN